MIDFEVTAYKFPQSRQSSKVLNSDLAGAKCKFGLKSTDTSDYIIYIFTCCCCWLTCLAYMVLATSAAAAAIDAALSCRE